MQDWNAYAAGFKRTRDHDPAFMQQWMERLAEVAGRTSADMPPGPWLDAGAGSGRFSAVLAAYWERDVIALELQPAMLALRDPHPRVRWVRGSALMPPIRAGTCAGVWVHLVLHQIEAWPDAVRRLAACVADGGVLGVRTFDTEVPDATLFAEIFPETEAIGARRRPPPGDVERVMQEAGLRTRRQSYADERETPADVYLAKIEGKAFSTLTMLDDATFAAGLARLRERLPPGSPPLRHTDRSVLIVGLRR